MFINNTFFNLAKHVFFRRSSYTTRFSPSTHSSKLRFFIWVRLMRNPEELPTERPNATEWNSAIELVKDNLATFANLRGGRMRASSYVDRSRKAHAEQGPVAL